MTTDAGHGIGHLGATLPVENVQELSSRNLKHIPHRYIQPEIASDVVSVDESSQIPVIDMSKLGADNVGYQTEMAKLHQACKEWGFFQLTDHGAAAAIEKMKVDAQEFFQLPLEEKMVYAQQPNGLEGYGQRFVVSEDQKLDWCDLLGVFSMPISARNLKFWPINPTSFRWNICEPLSTNTSVTSPTIFAIPLRSTIEEFSVELHKICISLYESVAVIIGVKFEKFVELHQEYGQIIRMNYYPPCSEADKVIGITPHSDASTLTLLVQVNDVEGLQIRNNGKWTPVKPIPGAIIVNVGDVLEIMSNGEYKSIEHRAVVDFHKERLSIAAFHNPSPKAIISPLVKDTNGAKYKILSYEDYLKQYFGSKLNGKSMLDSVRI